MTKREKRRKPTSSTEIQPQVDAATRSSRPEPAEPEVARRRFLWTALLGFLGLMIGEGVWVVLDFLRPRRTRPVSGSVVVAGPVERFELGSVTAFPQGRFYLVRLDAGGFLAVSRECTHLGCTVPWVGDEGRFVCPCHASAFDIRGDVMSPPAPRALDLYEVRIENRIVKVNTANLQKRRAFQAAQVTHA